MGIFIYLFSFFVNPARVDFALHTIKIQFKYQLNFLPLLSGLRARTKGRPKTHRWLRKFMAGLWSFPPSLMSGRGRARRSQAGLGTRSGFLLDGTLTLLLFRSCCDGHLRYWLHRLVRLGKRVSILISIFVLIFHRAYVLQH